MLVTRFLTDLKIFKIKIYLRFELFVIFMSSCYCKAHLPIFTWIYSNVQTSCKKKYTWKLKDTYVHKVYFKMTE